MFSSGVLKPDCLQRGLVEKVLHCLEEKGMKIVIRKELALSKEDVDILYQAFIGASFYSELCKYMMSGNVIFYVVWSGRKDTIEYLNDLVGCNDPEKAADHTIRRRYGTDIEKNVIHSTDNRRTFQREIDRFLSEDEKMLLKNENALFRV